MIDTKQFSCTLDSRRGTIVAEVLVGLGKAVKQSDATARPRPIKVGLQPPLSQRNFIGYTEGAVKSLGNTGSKPYNVRFIRYHPL